MNIVCVKLGSKPLKEALEDEDLAAPSKEDAKAIGNGSFVKRYQLFRCQGMFCLVLFTILV